MRTKPKSGQQAFRTANCVDRSSRSDGAVCLQAEGTQLLAATDPFLYLPSNKYGATDGNADNVQESVSCSLDAVETGERLTLCEPLSCMCRFVCLRLSMCVSAVCLSLYACVSVIVAVHPSSSLSRSVYSHAHSLILSRTM